MKMRNSIVTKFMSIMALSVLWALVLVPSQAGAFVMFESTNTGAIFVAFAPGTTTVISRAITCDVACQVKVEYTAECSVSAGDNTTWMKVEILSITGGVTTIQAPTNSDQAFCTSDSHPGGNWSSNAATALFNLAAGAHTISIRMSLQSAIAGESGTIDDQQLTILRNP